MTFLWRNPLVFHKFTKGLLVIFGLIFLGFLANRYQMRLKEEDEEEERKRQKERADRKAERQEKKERL